MTTHLARRNAPLIERALTPQLIDFLDANRVGLLPPEGIGPVTAAIVQRIADLPEPPEAQSDEDLAAIDRVILAITVEAVAAVNYLPTANEGAAS